MKIPVSWLKELIDSALPVAELSHRLTMAGLEIEGVEAVGQDSVLEVNVTPNRPDCLSILGIAREVRALTGKKLTLPPHSLKEAAPTGFNVDILDAELCPRYAGRVIRGVKVAPSPAWITERLEKCGIRSINNVVDITNYVLLEFGHPLHAFDLATLRGNLIRVGVAGKDRTIKTLDGSTRTLPEEALLIWDAERPVAVAGVMGGAETEVSNTTKDLFLESAYFKPASVRKTSKALGLSTEASYRFERGTDIEMLEAALDRAALLMCEIAGGKAEALVDAWPIKLKRPTVKVRYDRINKVLGTQLSTGEMLELLSRLDLKVQDEGQYVVVTPPAYRGDIAIEGDVMEEVARLWGYDRIPTQAPRAEVAATYDGTYRRQINTVRGVMTQGGYNEAVNYSFMDSKSLDMLGLAGSDRRRSTVEVRNPLRAEEAHMRTFLLPSMLMNLSRNVTHGMRKVALFETAQVFIARPGQQLPEETLMLGAIYYDEGSPRLYKDPTEPFYMLKGALETLLSTLHISGITSGVTFTPSAEPFLHPGKSADIMVEGKRVGWLGVLLPTVIEKMDLKIKRDVAVMELGLRALFAASEASTSKYRSLPRYPAVQRDISMLVEEGLAVAEVLGHIRSYACPEMEGAEVFDHYKGKNIPKGKKSLAFNVVYRSPERTLTDEEVEKIHAGLIAHLTSKTSGEVRGV